MLDLYGKSRAFVQFVKAGEPLQILSADVKATLRGDAGDSIWRVKVPGFGWRKVRYPTLRDQLAGQRAPYVILQGDERATVTA